MTGVQTCALPIYSLGAKGAKGIPERSDVGKAVEAATGGLSTLLGITGISDKDKAKLANLKNVALRLKTNYQNLPKLEAERGLDPSSPDPEIVAIIDKLLEGSQAPTTVRVKTKSGKIFDIPADKVVIIQEYKASPADWSSKHGIN